MDLKELLVPLLKWWWLIVVATLLAAFSSYRAVRQQPLVYEARTTLMIGRALDNPNPGNNEFWLGQQLAAAYADLGRREAVRETTMAALGMTWLPEYRVRALPNTQLLEIVVVDTNPARAQRVANELANQLILRSPTASRPEEQDRQAFVNEELNDLEASIKQTRDEIAAKQNELKELVSARQISDTQNQIGALQAKLSILQANYAALLANTQRGAVNTLTVIDAAPLPRRPVGSNTIATILTSAAIGFVMAASAAYFLAYLDDTVKEPGEINRLSDLPSLGSIPKFRLANEESPVIAAAKPRSPIAEAYRILRVAIQFANVDKPPRKLLVTSPTPEDGKSVMAANLAVVFAQAGHDVLLIDADLRQPQQHNLFALKNERGLTDLLLFLELRSPKAADESTSLVPGFIQTTPTVGLSVLTCGPIPPNPSELLGSTKMKVALAAFSAKFDYIIVDSPPCLAVADAAVLSTQMDGVIMIARSGRTRRSHLTQAVERLREVKADILGVSLNGLSSVAQSYYYHYAYSQEHDDSANGAARKHGPGAGNSLRRLRRRTQRLTSSKDE
jgi:polysaccharide biosynthesis transport protein